MEEVIQKQLAAGANAHFPRPHVLSGNGEHLGVPRLSWAAADALIYRYAARLAAARSAWVVTMARALAQAGSREDAFHNWTRGDSGKRFAVDSIADQSGKRFSFFLSKIKLHAFQMRGLTNTCESAYVLPAADPRNKRSEERDRRSMGASSGPKWGPTAGTRPRSPVLKLSKRERVGIGGNGKGEKVKMKHFLANLAASTALAFSAAVLAQPTSPGANAMGAPGPNPGGGPAYTTGPSQVPSPYGPASVAPTAETPAWALWAIVGLLVFMMLLPLLKR